MLFRFAIIVTILELVLTALASVLVTYTEPPPGFVTEADLKELGIRVEEHQNSRSGQMNAILYDTRAKLASPTATLYASLRTDALRTDFDFRRSREDVVSGRPERGESVVINEPLPGEEGYAVRHRGPTFVRFELVRFRRNEMLIVRVVREQPYDTLASAELSKCERRARAVQEHLMFKLRWRD